MDVFPKAWGFSEMAKKKNIATGLRNSAPHPGHDIISSAAIPSRLPPSKFIGQSTVSDDRGATVALDAVLIEIALHGCLVYSPECNFGHQTRVFSLPGRDVWRLMIRLRGLNMVVDW